jgi:hypothetical protein
MNTEKNHKHACHRNPEIAYEERQSLWQEQRNNEQFQSDVVVVSHGGGCLRLRRHCPKFWRVQLPCRGMKLWLTFHRS